MKKNEHGEYEYRGYRVFRDLGVTAGYYGAWKVKGGPAGVKPSPSGGYETRKQCIAAIDRYLLHHDRKSIAAIAFAGYDHGEENGVVVKRLGEFELESVDVFVLQVEVTDNGTTSVLPFVVRFQPGLDEVEESFYRVEVPAA